MYSGLEAREMVCMNSDIEGDDVDLAEEFVSLDLDSDWKGKDGEVPNSGDNNSESDQEEIDKYPAAKKVENSSMPLRHQKCLKLCVRKNACKIKMVHQNHL